ncbi:MAG: hypothetical protein HC869_05190 [Rhodospirillales bacterium]|nr:hypothetical protein [Rhodospirillales bacterium]
MDVLIVNRKENARLFRNNAKSLGNWIGVKLEREGANRDGIGAWIEVRVGARSNRAKSPSVAAMCLASMASGISALPDMKRPSCA